MKSEMSMCLIVIGAVWVKPLIADAQTVQYRGGLADQGIPRALASGRQSAEIRPGDQFPGGGTVKEVTGDTVVVEFGSSEIILRRHDSPEHK